MAKEQESGYPLWSIHETGGLMVSPPTLCGVLCITSWSVFPRNFEGEARLPCGLPKDVLDEKEEDWQVHFSAPTF